MQFIQPANIWSALWLPAGWMQFKRNLFWSKYHSLVARGWESLYVRAHMYSSFHPPHYHHLHSESCFFNALLLKRSYNLNATKQCHQQALRLLFRLLVSGIKSFYKNRFSHLFLVGCLLNISSFSSDVNWRPRMKNVMLGQQNMRSNCEWG